MEIEFNQQYLDRLAQDDAEATQHFYAYFYKLLLVSLRYKLNSPSLIEDAAQETLLRVLVAVRKGEIQYPERLFGFVRSVSVNVAKEIGRKNTRFQQIPENNPEPVAKARSAEQNYINDEMKGELLQALQKLSEKDRDLLVKVYIREEDKSAVSSELGIDRSTLRVRVFRALARLRETMKPAAIEPPLAKKVASR